MGHLFRIAALTACLTLFMLLPFLPGRYDSLAVPLSMMAQLFGMVGLLLVPVGLAWIAYEYGSPLKEKRRVFALVGLVASSMVWFTVSFGAMSESIALGVGALGLGAALTLRLWPQVKAMSREPVEERAAVVSLLPLYLIVLPLAMSLRIGIKEIVIYNPRGEQAISSHALDVLQLSPEQLALDRTRGHNAVHDASQPNWKFFWFD